MAQRLYRSEDDKVISGLCGGVGEFFDLDPTIIRIVFVILTIWGGVGVILYIIGVLVVPVRPSNLAEGEKKTKNTDFTDKINEIAQDLKEKVNNKNRKMLRGEVIIGSAIILFGLLLFIENFLPHYGLDLFWPIMLILFGFYVLSGTFKKGNK